MNGPIDSWINILYLGIFHIKSWWGHSLGLFHGSPQGCFFFSYINPKRGSRRNFSLFPIDNLPSWVKTTSLVGPTSLMKAWNTN